jgi:hypothetical protein
LHGLLALVQASEGEAADLALQILNIARGTALEPALHAVSRALEQFDFDEAEGLLTQALQTPGQAGADALDAQPLQARA